MKAWNEMKSDHGARVRLLAMCLVAAGCGGGDDTSRAAPAVVVDARETASALATSRPTKGKVPRARAWRGVTAIDVAPDGGVAIAGADGSVQLQADGATVTRAVSDPSGIATTALAFSADGKQLVSVGRDSVTRVWNVATRSRVLSLHGHEHPIRSVAVSADGAWVASAGDETRVMLWNAGSGKLARVLGGHASFVNAVAFSPDSRMLATGDATGQVVIWNLVNGVPRQKLAEHTDEVNSLAFSPDGSLLATAGEDGRVVLWSADSGQKLQVLAGHEGGVRSLAFSRDGRWLGTGGADAKVLVWDMATRSLSRSLPATASVNTMVFDIHRRKDVLLAGAEDGRLLRWDVARGEPR